MEGYLVIVQMSNQKPKVALKCLKLLISNKARTRIQVS